MKTKKGQRTYNLVENFFEENPEALQVDAAETLGLSKGTISYYVNRIKEREGSDNLEVSRLERKVQDMWEIVRKRNNTIENLKRFISDWVEEGE